MPFTFIGEIDEEMVITEVQETTPTTLFSPFITGRILKEKLRMRDRAFVASSSS